MLLYSIEVASTRKVRQPRTDYFEVNSRPIILKLRHDDESHKTSPLVQRHVQSAFWTCLCCLQLKECLCAPQDVGFLRSFKVFPAWPACGLQVRTSPPAVMLKGEIQEELWKLKRNQLCKLSF